MADQKIPTESSVVKGEDKIEKVAQTTLSQTTSPEAELYNISFANYKLDKCSIKGIEPWNAQAAIKIVRDIGIDFKGGNFESENYTIKPVMNSRPYDDYYKNLPEEIVGGQEVREIIYEREKNDNQVFLRVFFYTLQNIFYMLAISTVHQNLDHKDPQFKREKKERSGLGKVL